MRLRRGLTIRLLAGGATAALVLGSMLLLGFVPLVTVSVGAAGRAYSCADLPGTPYPLEGLNHLPYEGAPHQPYRTVPPTSGPHSPRVLSPGVYREPVPEELQVHFLEHGHVLVQYARGAPAAAVAVLERVARRHPRDVAVAPYPKLSRGMALTGWQRLDRAEVVDASMTELFVERVSGRYEHGWRDGATDCLTS